MKAEYDIENAKIELALKADFSIDNAYLLFDPKEKGYISERDLEQVFHLLNIYPTRARDTIILLKQYDCSNKGVLVFENVFDMLTPYDKDYRHLVENRKPSPYHPKYNKTDLFLSSTKEQLKNLIQIMIRNEIKAEEMRNEINKMYTINIAEFFKTIDKGSIGSISELDLDVFMKENNIAFIPKEISLLFKRIDRLREGKISLRQFLHEYTPRVNIFI